MGKMQYFKNNSQTANRLGVTLVEILIVIVIMSVLSALIIPRVRTINKDRNIRETARVVGSMFASASQRAAAEGNAGVMIRRNGNFVDSDFVDANGNPVSYAATTLYLMRAVPDFTGDDGSAQATQVSSVKCQIVTPLDNDVVQVNDRIFLNNQRFGYRIRNIDPPDGSGPLLELTLETYDNSVNGGVRRTTYPALNFSNGVPFRIERRPRVVQSSAIELPAGYQVDLRYSGWFDDGSGAYAVDSVRLMNVDDVDPDGDPNTINADIQVIFNERGGIESVDDGTDFNQKFLPTSSLYLFVAEDDLKLDLNQDRLVRDSNLWVIVNHLNGGTSIGYNASPGPYLDRTDTFEMRNRITNARGLATNRQNAAQ